MFLVRSIVVYVFFFFIVDNVPIIAVLLNDVLSFTVKVYDVELVTQLFHDDQFFQFSFMPSLFAVECCILVCNILAWCAIDCGTLAYLIIIYSTIPCSIIVACCIIVELWFIIVWCIIICYNVESCIIVEWCIISFTVVCSIIVVWCFIICYIVIWCIIFCMLLHCCMIHHYCILDRCLLYPRMMYPCGMIYHCCTMDHYCIFLHCFFHSCIMYHCWKMYNRFRLSAHCPQNTCEINNNHAITQPKVPTKKDKNHSSSQRSCISKVAFTNKSVDVKMFLHEQQWLPLNSAQQLQKQLTFSCSFYPPFCLVLLSVHVSIRRSQDFICTTLLCSWRNYNYINRWTVRWKKLNFQDSIHYSHHVMQTLQTFSSKKSRFRNS